MAYSELIKNFNKIRDYMRQFYVYGFRKREEYDRKSARSYDNERRRIESWLGEYMSFRQESSGKITFISVDSSEVRSNPLYNAFKAKSFTANDIVLNFCILDILQEGEQLGVAEITDRITEDYMSLFEEPKVFDEALVRNKLKEYADEGILTSAKAGRKVLYQRAVDAVDLDPWKEAIEFYSEADPMGVIGSFLMDKMPDQDKMPEPADLFSFKHHYMLFALESDILCSLLLAMADDCTVELAVNSIRKKKIMKYHVLPLQIGMSTETGRMYLLGQERKYGQFNMYRMDRIESVARGDVAADKEQVAAAAADFVRHLWNTSSGSGDSLDHLEMTLRVESEESFILQRLAREGKHGKVEKLGEDRFRFTIDVYDATEMQPWLRTFIGRVESLTCTNKEVEDVFYRDLDAMYALYGMSGTSASSALSGGDANAVQ